MDFACTCMRSNCIPSDEVAKEIVGRSTCVVSLDCLLSWPASYRFIEYTWKNVARTIYITIMRARRRLYRALSTLRRLKQKTHRRLRGPSHKKRFERGFGNCSVAAKCAKKSLWFYFPPMAWGNEGSLVKAKSNRYFPEAVTTMTRRFLTRCLLITNLARDINFLITFALVFLSLWEVDEWVSRKLNWSTPLFANFLILIKVYD